MRGALVRRVRHWVANRGWRGFLAEVWRRAKILARLRRRAGAETRAVREVHPFDERYGVDTGGMIWGEKLLGSRGEKLLASREETPPPSRGETPLETGGERSGEREVGPAGAGAPVARAGARESAYWATGYYGIAPTVLWQAMDRLGMRWEGTTFVDVGCGKGRAMMLATRYPLRAVVGVELSAELAAVAERNLRRFAAEWRRPEVPVRVVWGDATEFVLPAGPLVLLVYHPFAAPVMRRFLEGVERSVQEEPREIVLLYANPELGPMLRAMPWLEAMWEECFGMDEEERAADRFGSEWEKIAAFRTVGRGGAASQRGVSRQRSRGG